MGSFHDDRNALRLEYQIERIGDLRGHSLLNLQPLREDLDQPR
jgi:hypothetical protein